MSLLGQSSPKASNYSFILSQGVVPFVISLTSEECPSSGEVFTASAFRAARETFATFLGVKADTAEGFIENWDKVMGKGQEPYLANDTLDHVKYIIRHAHGTEMEDIADFSIVEN